jgi:hypothetical protein
LSAFQKEGYVSYIRRIRNGDREAKDGKEGVSNLQTMMEYIFKVIARTEKDPSLDETH